MAERPISYQVQIREAGRGSWIQVSHGGMDPEIVVRNLVPNIDYEVRVRARGEGVFAPPKNIRLRRIDSTTIHINWDPPDRGIVSSNNRPVYEVNDFVIGKEINRGSTLVGLIGKRKSPTESLDDERETIFLDFKTLKDAERYFNDLANELFKEGAEQD